MLTLQVVGDSIYQGTKISWNLMGWVILFYTRFGGDFAKISLLVEKPH